MKFSTIITSHFYPRKTRALCIAFLLNFVLVAVLSTQVTYDNNVADLGIVEETDIIQNAFTAPAGNERILVAFIMRNGQYSASDSLTFDGQHMTRQIGLSGNGGVNTEMWSLTLGCGSMISDSLKAFFSTTNGILPDVLIHSATFQNVDQFTSIGGTGSSGGSSATTAALSVITSDTNSLILGNVMTRVLFGEAASITTDSPGQIELFEQSIGQHSTEGSINNTTGTSDEMSWIFSKSCIYVTVGIELLSSDQDGDGISDCNDLCPMDSLKSDPGICGCGLVDVDSDDDGTLDCDDLCPLDSLKLDPGICGCGVEDIDTDGDGTMDCIDLCQFDSLKIDPGMCGCGVADDDGDGDGVVNCLDDCPNDSTLIADFDSDGDGVADCVDLCPFDAFKLEPGTCGCGVADVDSDLNGIVDCNEKGDVVIVSSSSTSDRGSTMQGRQVSTGGDTTVLWSLGNRTRGDSAVVFMQYLHDNMYLGAGNIVGLTIDGLGRVGLGRQPSSNLLEVNGKASKSTPGNWLGNSDARLKKHILPLDPDEMLSKLLQLHAVTYEWNDTITGMDRPAGVQYGFLAQDIRKVFPQLVFQDSSGYLQTSYGTFDPMLLEGIRCIDQDIDSLQNAADNLMRRMDRLEGNSKTIRKEGSEYD